MFRVHIRVQGLRVVKSYSAAIKSSEFQLSFETAHSGGGTYLIFVFNKIMLKT